MGAFTPMLFTLMHFDRPFYVYVNSRTRPISGSAHRDAASRLCEASRSAFLNLQNCYPADVNAPPSK